MILRLLCRLLSLAPSLRYGLFLHFDMCYNCFSLPCKAKAVTKVTLDYYTPCEQEIVCSYCGFKHDYYAYGYTESDYARAEYEIDCPKTNLFFEKLSKFYYEARALYNKG